MQLESFVTNDKIRQFYIRGNFLVPYNILSVLLYNTFPNIDLDNTPASQSLPKALTSIKVNLYS